ncbi:MAG: PAS domain S-box protein [Caldilineaceae bacterium]
MLRTIADRIFPRIERARAEAALAASEAKYRMLFNSIDQGFFIVEVIQDAAGNAVDWRHLEVNPAVARMNGLANATGKLASEMLGKIESAWLEPYDQVLRTGEPIHTENYNHATDHWHQARYSRIGDAGSRLVAVVFDDITERKREQERQAYLLKLSDALHALEDATSIKTVANRLLGLHLAADRVVYEEHVRKDGKEYWLVENIYHVPAYPLAEGLYPVESFGRDSYIVLNGETAIVNDVAADAGIAPAVKEIFAAINIAAYVALPVIRAGKPVALFTLNQATPRVWQPHEVALLVETAARTWAMVERARLAEALRQSEERLRGVLDGMDESFGLLAPDFTILEHNREALRLDGRARAEIIGRSHWEVYPGTETSELGRLYKQAMAERVPVSLEHRYAWTADRARWLEMRAYPTDDGSLAVFWRDVTDRRETQEALRQSEEKYRTLFESIDEGFCIIEVIFDAHGKAFDLLHLEANEAYERYTGLRNIVGKRAREIVPDSGPWLDFYGNVALTGEPARLEAYLPPDVDRWISSFASRIGGEGSRQVAVVFNDITERKRAEETLRQSEARFRALVNATSYVVYRMSPDWREMRELDGQGFLADTQSASTTWLDEYIDPNDQPQVQAAIAHAIRAKRMFELEHRMRRADGTLAWTLSRAVPLLDENGEIVEWFGAAGDVTARRQAEEALRASETRIRIAVEAAQLATWEWHLHTDEIYWNDQHFLLFDMPPHATPVKPSGFFAHVHPADQDWLAARLQAAIAERSVFAAEFRCITAGGAHCWMSGYGRVMAEVDGQATHMSGVMFDITERKVAEAALRESEARQAIILETMAEGVVSIDPHGRFLSVNAAAERILGVARTELVGVSVMEPPFRRFALDGEPWGQRPPLAEVAAAAGRIFHNDYLIERRDGSQVIVSRNITALRATGGTLLGFVSTLSDITEQKRIEASLRDSEERFRTVANLVPDLLWSSDPKGATGWYNQRWLEYTGQTLAAAVQQGWLAAVHVDDQVGALRHLQRTAEQGVPLRQELRLRRGDGVYHWFLVQVQSIFDDAGQVVRWFGAATDIHEQRIVRNTLEHHVAERTQEVAMVSATRQHLLDRLITAQEDERRRIARDLHDSLGQHLVTLDIGLKTIQMLNGYPADVEVRIQALRAMVQQMDTEVERLTVALRPPALDDLGLPDALRRHVHQWAADSDIAIDLHIRGLLGHRLPAEVETAIFRIVQEALTNIRKHAQATHVSLLLEQRSGEVQVIVEDNGQGFDMATVQAIHGERAHLGLNGMRERTALVGGQLEVESRPGAGTTLYLHIPLVDR